MKDRARNEFMVRLGWGRAGRIGLVLALVSSAALAQSSPTLSSRQRPSAPLLFDEMHRMLPRKLANTLATALGDIDGDGDLDVYSAKGSDELLLNDGVGRLRPGAFPLPITGFGTWAVGLGDLDGDGDLDAFLGREQDDLVLRNQGLARFQLVPNALPRDFERAGAVVLEDFDGDGDLDALVGNQFGSDRLRLNGGAAVFVDGTRGLPAGSTGTLAAVAGDFDDDGDADLVVTPSPEVRLLLNDGSASFALASANVPAHPYVTYALAAGDVDVDGDLDLYLGNRPGPGSGTARNLLYLNDGVGVFANDPSRVPDVGNFTLSVALGDVDGDGAPDLFVGDEEDHLLRNDGIGFFTSSPQSLPPLPPESGRALTIGFGDLDGDLDLDLFLGRGIFEGAEDRLYLNDGDGLFADVTHAAPLPPYHDRSEQSAWADVDGDGDVDGVVANSPNSLGGEPEARNRLLRNDGTGNFADASADLSSSPAEARSLALGDLDGDEDVDVLLGNSGFFGAQNEIRLNDGHGVFSRGTGLPAILDDTEAVVLADLDRDGDLDAVLGDDSDFSNRLLLNDGRGVFADASGRLPVQGDRTDAVLVGDVDADGDGDLVLGNRGQRNRLFLNDGAAHFLDASAQLPFGTDDTLALALGDVDGDGDADLFVATSGQNRLHLNDGTGHFTPAPAGALPTDSDTDRAVAMGDVDEDGDLDLVLAVNNGFLGQNALYTNDGHGVFRLRRELLPARLGKNQHVALVDVDGDSDLDLFCAIGDSESTADRGFGNVLLVNRTRQLAWQAKPRVGKRLVLEISGRPRERWRLLAAAGRATIPFRPYGTLFLDPTSLHDVAAGTTDAVGLGTYATDVPDDLALVGSTLYWQAQVGPRLRLTNLEPTLLSSY